MRSAQDERRYRQRFDRFFGVPFAAGACLTLVGIWFHSLAGIGLGAALTGATIFAGWIAWSVDHG